MTDRRGRRTMADNSERSSRDSFDDREHYSDYENNDGFIKRDDEETIPEIQNNPNNIDKTDLSFDNIDDPSCTLYVSRMSYKTKEEDMRRLFTEYGEVVDCRLVINPLTRESRCFGFITMNTPNEANSAKEKLDGSQFQDATIKVENARRSRPYKPTPGEYKGPQFRSIRYSSHSRGAPYRQRGPPGPPRYPSRSRGYDSHMVSSPYPRESHGYYDDHYNRYPEYRHLPRQSDSQYNHRSHHSSPPRHGRSDPYDSRYTRR